LPIKKIKKKQKTKTNWKQYSNITNKKVKRSKQRQTETYHLHRTESWMGEKYNGLINYRKYEGFSVYHWVIFLFKKKKRKKEKKEK
jgi:hypothetical protein